MLFSFLSPPVFWYVTTGYCIRIEKDSYLFSEQLQNRVQTDVSWRQRNYHRITENNVGNRQLYIHTRRKKFAHKLSVALLLLKKSNSRILCSICPKKFPLLIDTSPSNGIKLFSAVLSVTSIKRFVKCTPGNMVHSRAHLWWNERGAHRHTTNTA